MRYVADDCRATNDCTIRAGIKIAGRRRDYMMTLLLGISSSDSLAGCAR